MGKAKSRIPADVLRLRIAPDCGHNGPAQCPLEERDWEEIYRAWRAFRAVCVSVSEAAHKKAGT